MGHHQNSPFTYPKRRKPRIRYVVMAFFVLAAVLAAKSEIPAFSVWLDSLLQPQIARAKTACQEKALAAADSQQAEILLPGSMQKMDDGFIIQGVLVKDGTKDFVYTCFADRKGNVLRHGKAD